MKTSQCKIVNKQQQVGEIGTGPCDDSKYGNAKSVHLFFIILRCVQLCCFK